MKYTLFLLVLLIGLSACGPDLPEPVLAEYEKLPDHIDYNIHVKPILSDRCFACHGNDKNKLEAGLRLNEPDGAYGELPETPGKYAIVPHKLKQSQLFYRIFSEDPNIVMPTPESNLTLSDYEKAVLVKWIEDGAEFKPHWAFTPPKQPTLPKVQNADWPQNAIDHFVLAKLEENDWTFAEPADKETLLRRVTFDLTGLPPTLEEINNFLNDKTADAYEKVVDRLLASEAYAERMTTEWMDLARFADTHGYTVDRFRDMSPWRDWVIKAFDQNMPYDTFTIWQLAGDLLPNATQEQILATGFNRNHQQNMEGGIVDEEFRVEYVADRTNTLGAAFLGLTVECARCHDHKYDPISQKEYFELFSFFNSVNEAGQISYDNAIPGPSLMLPSEKTLALLKEQEQKIQEQQAKIEANKQKEISAFVSWLEESNKAKWSTSQKGLVAEYHFEKDIVNRLNPRQKGEMKQMFAKPENLKTNFTTGKNGHGLLLDGDAWVDLGKVGAFDKATPFSIGLWINIPKELKNGVVFHKGQGAALYNYRGFHLAIKDDRLEIVMGHTLPHNAIVEYADNPPRDQWIHLMLTYDGSSKAVGLKAYLNGAEQATEVQTDNLYKGILFNAGQEGEPGLQIGARWRGAGAKGATVDEFVVFDRTLSELEVLNIVDAEAFQSFMDKSFDTYTTEEKEKLKAYYLGNVTTLEPLKNQLIELHRAKNKIQDTIKEVMVMEEMPKPRPSYVLERGLYDAHGEQVFPATIKAVLPFSEDYPSNRLGLAQWLFHPDHPLTARVAVNRYWSMLFGRGLVKTAIDFGNQGALPSHPELLDWLAIHFRESGWDIKGLLKTIVLSSTYQQSSVVRDDMAEVDVENVFLWRGPSVRLSAEMMRDNALAASALLVHKVGGKSVKPYQPEGLWAINGGKYEQDEGENLYRRSLYTFWKRSVPLPTQGTFDAPSRSVCTVERQKTSTPLQSLILLNDPTFIEASKVLGEQMAKIESASVAITRTFKKLTGRTPEPGEVEILLKLQEKNYKKFLESPDKMTGWLKSGAYEVDANIPPAMIAANAVVASTILNADASIIKR